MQSLDNTDSSRGRGFQSVAGKRLLKKTRFKGQNAKQNEGDGKLKLWASTVCLTQNETPTGSRQGFKEGGHRKARRQMEVATQKQNPSNVFGSAADQDTSPPFDTRRLPLEFQMSINL